MVGDILLILDCELSIKVRRGQMQVLSKLIGCRLNVFRWGYLYKFPLDRLPPLDPLLAMILSYIGLCEL
jgi:hypothetical protein